MSSETSTPTPTLTPTGRRRRMVRRSWLAMLIGSHAVVDFHAGVVPVLLPFLVAARGYDYTAAAGITLAAALSSLVQPLFGVLTDRRRMPWLILVGPLVAGIGIALAGQFDVYAAIWCAVALSGLGIAAYHPEASSSARRASGGSAQGMSWFSVGGFAGIAVAPLVAEPVLRHAGLSGTGWLVLPGLGAFLVLLPLSVWLRRRQQPSPVPVDRPGGDSAPRRDDWRGFGWLTAAVVTRSMLHFGVTAFVALYLIHHLHTSTGVGAAGLTTFLGFGTVGTIVGGILGDRLGRVCAMRIGYLGCLPGLLLLLLAPSVPVAFVGIALLGFCTMLPFAVQVTLGHEYLPNRLGTASGVTLGVATTVGGAVTPLLGRLGDAYGLPVALTALFAVPVLCLLFSLRLSDTSP